MIIERSKAYEKKFEGLESKRADEIVDLLKQSKKLDNLNFIPITSSEVTARLEKCGVELNIEGENDQDRYKRLLESELLNEHYKIEDHEDDEAQNDQLSNSDSPKRRKLTDNISDESHLSPFDKSCEKVKDWLQRMVFERDEELAQIPLSVRDNLEHRTKLSQQEQTKLYFRPLLRCLRKRDMNPSVLKKLESICDACEQRDYSSAHHKYSELAIGNAPWSLGVTGVGLHERASQMRISAEQVAHLLNDETVRRYIVMIKRLLTQIQQRRPSDT